MGKQPVRGILEQERDMLDRTDNSRDDAFVESVGTGSRGTGQYRCVDCGYGITIHADLPDCPMCGGNEWEETPWSPISNAATAPTPVANL
jgi:rubredoxin